MKRVQFFGVTKVVMLCALMLSGAASKATSLTVSHWASGMYGAPFAVAFEKGYFKEAGVNVSGAMSSPGGGTAVRNAMASEIPYGEVALSAAIAASKQGVDLTIVHGGVISMADVYCVTKTDSPLKSIGDLKGKKFGYSSPKSTTDMISVMAFSHAGILDEVDRKAVGSQSAAMIALREGAVDAVYISEPTYSKEQDNLKILFKFGDVLPDSTQTVGIVRTDYLKKHPEIIKGIITARRKGVEFIFQHPEEAGEIVAKQYRIPVDIAKMAIRHVLAGQKTYWSEGQLDYAGMEEMLKGLILIKAIEPGTFDWSKVVDESFLPPDLRSKKKE